MTKPNSSRKKANSTVISMDRGQFKMIDKRKRETLSISCNEGTLWVTAAGDEQDYVLRAGQSIELSENVGNVLLQSISPRVEVGLRGAS
jgi:ferric-dicitrate binding protein FerR (iron transport regulator)